MQTLHDEQARAYTVRVHANTERGRVDFYTDTGNHLEACSRIKEQTGARWVDRHHAKVTIL